MARKHVKCVRCGATINVVKNKITESNDYEEILDRYTRLEALKILRYKRGK